MMRAISIFHPFIESHVSVPYAVSQDMHMLRTHACAFACLHVYEITRVRVLAAHAQPTVYQNANACLQNSSKARTCKGSGLVGSMSAADRSCFSASSSAPPVSSTASSASASAHFAAHVHAFIHPFFFHSSVPSIMHACFFQ